MDDLDAVELAKCFYCAPMVAERDHLVEAKHIAAVFNVIHLNLHRGAAAAGGRGVNIADHRARIEDELVGVLEADEGDGRADWP